MCHKYRLGEAGEGEEGRGGGEEEEEGGERRGEGEEIGGEGREEGGGGVERIRARWEQGRLPAERTLMHLSSYSLLYCWVHKVHLNICASCSSSF